MTRTAIITGGTGAIGLAIAEKLLSEGLNVVLIGSNQKSLEKSLALQSQYEKTCSFWHCDLTNAESIDSCINGIVSSSGSIDVVVNCAGRLELHDPEDLTEEIWDQVIDTNLKSYFFVIKSCLPALKESTNPRIVNISSNAGRMGGYANGPAYAASKGGIISLSYNLDRKLAKYGITVNCIAPGTIETHMTEKISESSKKSLLEKFPMGRFGAVNDVAAAVSFFIQEENSFLTGAVLDVNGGLFMG